MSVILTAIFRVTNWHALRHISDQSLVIAAQAAGATRYQLYRNVHDAGEALLFAECASHEALVPIARALAQIDQGIARPQDPLVDTLLDDRVWEPAACRTIGEER